MNITELLLIIILAEVSYLVAVNTKKLSHRRDVQPIFVDTSVLIDGRIIAVAKSGFIGGKLYVPRSVIGELQFLADNADPEKRSRARYGLDVVAELQNIPGLKIEIFQDGSRAEEGVDERLLNLARKNNGVICTIDFNLNKVAKVEGITVLNVNDLAMSLRMAYLPGEKILLELTQKGQDAHQAVGHLADGTMVVVEHASGQIGKTVEIEFIRSLQTAAGKMMFAKTVRSLDNRKPVSGRRETVRLTNKPVGKPNNDRRTQTSKYNSHRNDQRPNRNKQYKSKSAQNEQDLIDLMNKQ